MTVQQPWPGSKCQMSEVQKYAGDLEYWEIFDVLKITDPGTDDSVTMTAGEDFVVWSSHDRLIRTGDEVGEVNWVIDGVTLDGTVELYVGIDPEWSFDLPDIGGWGTPVSYTTIGDRLVVPLPEEYRTVEFLRGNLDGPLLRVKVTSGTLTAFSLYLQTEPPDGLKVRTGYSWSDYEAPPLVQKQADIATGHAGAGYHDTMLLSRTDALDALLDGFGNDEPPLAPPTTPPYRYSRGARISPGGSGSSFSYERCISEASGSGAWVDVGYVVNFWTEKPTLRERPAWFAGGTGTTDFLVNRDWEKVDSGFGISSYGEWAPGADTVAIDWANAGVTVTHTSGSLTDGPLGTNIGFASGELIPSTAGAWTGEFTWPPPLGGATVNVQHEDLVDGYFVHDFGVPGSGTDFTVTAIGDQAMGVHPTQPDLTGAGVDWQNWNFGVQGSIKYQMPSFRYRVPTFEASADAIIPEPEGPGLLPGVDPAVPASSSDTGDYVYEGDVGTGTTPPLLWFLYKKWAFLGDSIVVYGQGLGDTQAELNGVLKLGPGLDYPIVADVTPSVTEWTLNAAGDHAYDGTGVIFPGTTIAPPVVDMEVQTVEFVVPPGMTLTEPTEMHVYVTNDNGTSNMLTLMLYPMVDLDMEAGDPLLLTMASGMGVFARAEDDAFEQRYSLLSPAYALTGRRPERAPEYLTDAAGDFTLTIGAPTTGLDDPVDITLPLLLRYRPLDSKVEPRPDLGTGMSVWNSNEGSTMDLKFHVDSAPFVDDETTVDSRNGEILRPAMVFPGDAWAETTNGFAVGPRLTVAMVVTVYPDAQPRSYLLSSFVSGAPDPDTFPLEVYVIGDEVRFVIGTKLQAVKIAPGYVGRRPIIVAFSIDPSICRTAVVSDRPKITLTRHAPLTSAGLKLYFGRSNDAGNLQMATMDVLDLGLDITFAGPERFWTVLNRLDSAYGVMK